MKYFSADLIFTNLGAPFRDSVVVTDDGGTIVDILNKSEVSSDVEHIKGALVPGFVNAHCHMELSHLKGKLDTGTGLIPFIRSVVTMRDFPQEEIIDAINRADREMYKEGIVAVGDISNTLDTAQCKDESPILYYTFVEMFDFLLEDQAGHYFDQYRKVYDGQSDSGLNRKSCVPHAPYSASRNLLKKITDVNRSKGLVSIHNQETIHEDHFFKKKEGDLLEFFSFFDINLDHFEPTGKSSIHYALAHMDPSVKSLFIHNTMSSKEDIAAAHQWSDGCYWVTCPNANLYIENKLPDYGLFVNEGARMAVGTDSLTSNWQLSILEELKTIQRYQSTLDTETLIKWSSYNAAEAMDYEHLGSIDLNKRPGLIALEAPVYNGQLLLKDVERHYRMI